jgi:hypothetical protein
MLDPQTARRVLKEYYATATDQQIIDDVRRFSPELAERHGIGLAGSVRHEAGVLRAVRGVFNSLGQSVLRLFS